MVSRPCHADVRTYTEDRRTNVQPVTNPLDIKSIYSLTAA